MSRKVGGVFWKILLLLNLVMKTNWKQYLQLIYFVNQPLHISGDLAHHQEAFNVYIQQLVRVIRLG
jgi:pterin-4a-carbinolamine dehydratase